MSQSKEWSLEDCQDLDKFLRSGLGTRLLGCLEWNRGAIFTRGATAESTALNAAEIAGYERALSTLKDLSSVKAMVAPVKPTEQYPSLYDDKAWEGVRVRR